MGCGASAHGKRGEKYSKETTADVVEPTRSAPSKAGLEEEKAATSPTAQVTTVTVDKANTVSTVRLESNLKVEELDVESAHSPLSPAARSQATICATPTAGPWWSIHALWIAQRAREIVEAYNYFFEHITLRKGWRVAPFRREDVQAPFQAAAEVVTVVRARLDEQKPGFVLRQLEGSAMDYFWGWSPDRPPSCSQKVLVEFFRGLVFATLSDARGLVEGLDTLTIEHYVSRHPILQNQFGESAEDTAATAAADDTQAEGVGAAEGTESPTALDRTAASISTIKTEG